MIKAIIIDDEPLAASIVKQYLKKYDTIQVVQECNNGFEGVKAVTQYQPDLIFLDIQMPKINGFEMLELLDSAPAVIFTTAFDEYAIKAFEASAVDYLLKPFSQERFDKALQKWLNEKENYTSGQKIEDVLEKANIHSDEQYRVVVKSGSEIRIIPIQDVLYFEAYDDYVKINTADDCFLKKKTMTSYENTLNPSQFVRVHRSFIVQLQQVSRIEPVGKDSHTVSLKNGVKIPLSKTGYAKLKEVLGLG